MGEIAVTLSNLFGLSAKGLWEGGTPAIEPTEPIAALKRKLLSEVPAVRWPSIVAELTKQAQALFEVDLIDVLTSAWSKYRELAKYADRDAYPPGDTHLVPLAEHTLKATYHPFLEILVNGKPLGKVVFDVSLALNLKGFVLGIQDAKIKKVLTGSCQGKGAIMLGRAVLVEKTLAPIPLPGSIDLGEGISLSGPGRLS